MAPLSASADPVEKRMSEIAAFTLPCPLYNGKPVPPMTCRSCSQKRTCVEVSALYGADREYAAKFKGTIMESAMKRAGESKKLVAEFILGMP